MSLNVGAGGRQGADSSSSKLRAALTDLQDRRGVDRVLAESFWRPSTATDRAARIARVLPLPLRRT